MSLRSQQPAVTARAQRPLAAAAPPAPARAGGGDSGDCRDSGDPGPPWEPRKWSNSPGIPFPSVPAPSEPHKLRACECSCLTPVASDNNSISTSNSSLLYKRYFIIFAGGCRNRLGNEFIVSVPAVSSPLHSFLSQLFDFQSTNPCGSSERRRT